MNKIIGSMLLVAILTGMYWIAFISGRSIVLGIRRWKARRK